jgi:hypothetical protein
LILGAKNVLTSFMKNKDQWQEMKAMETTNTGRGNIYAGVGYLCAAPDAGELMAAMGLEFCFLKQGIGSGLWTACAARDDKEKPSLAWTGDTPLTALVNLWCALNEGNE